MKGAMAAAGKGAKPKAKAKAKPKMRGMLGMKSGGKCKGAGAATKGTRYSKS
jgi:hypothetical protein